MFHLTYQTILAYNDPFERLGVPANRERGCPSMSMNFASVERRAVAVVLALFLSALQAPVSSPAAIREGSLPSQRAESSPAPDLTPDGLLRNIAARHFTGRPITIRVTGQTLQSAVEAIQKVSGLSIDIDPAVYELIRKTSSNKDVIVANHMPWDALLDVLSREFGLGIAPRGDSLVLRSIISSPRRIDIAEPRDRFPAWVWILLPVLVLLAAGTVVIFVAGKKAARKRDRMKFSLDHTTAEQIKTKILYSFEVEKLHHEEDLSLQTLAARLSLPAHHISWVTNEIIGQSFSRLVNSYRIDEVKERLLDPRDASRTILDIAFEAGFRTKTAFNKVFKSLTGTTPSEFREKSRG